MGWGGGVSRFGSPRPCPRGPMKFGQNLLACVYEPWLPHYIDYAALKPGPLDR